MLGVKFRKEQYVVNMYNTTAQHVILVTYVILIQYRSHTEETETGNRKAPCAWCPLRGKLNRTATCIEDTM